MGLLEVSSRIERMRPVTKRIGLLYDSKEKCIICSKEFPVKKVRKSRLKLVKSDADFCNYYKDINPYYYEFLVCKYCKTIFTPSLEEYLKRDDIETRKKIINFYSQMENISSLEGERSLEDALRVSKLSILTANIIGVPYGLIANIFMRVAWLNRFKKDIEEEEKYLQLAYKNYKKSYEEGEKVLSEEMLTYLLGELSNQLGDFKKCKIWFSLLFSMKKDIAIVDKGRDRWLSIKDNNKA